MSTLQGRQHNNTYLDLLHIENSNQGFDTVLRRIESGNGDQSVLSLSTIAAQIDGALTVTGVSEFNIRPTVNGVGVLLVGEGGGGAIGVQDNNTFIQWRDSADENDRNIIGLNSGDEIDIGNDDITAININGGTGDVNLFGVGVVDVSSSGDELTLGGQNDVTISSAAGVVSLVHNLTTVLSTQDLTAGDNTSSVSLLDGGNVARDCGFNVMPHVNRTGAQSIGKALSGYQIVNTGAAATWTIDDTNGSNGITYAILNNGSGAITIAAGTLNWYDGSAVQTGNRTLAVGGVATVTRSLTADTYHIWGAGLS